MSEIKLSTVLDLIKHKNAVGYELLYTHYSKLMFGTAFSVTKNEEDSRDIVQNVVFKLSKTEANKFPEKGETSWLYRVVKNEALNLIKSRKTYVRLDADDVDIPMADKNLDELFDMENYYSLIAELNEQQKEVVTLKVLCDLSHKEIAKALDKPIGTVQWIYNTSIKKLRVALVAMASFMVVLFLGAMSRVVDIYGSLPVFDPPMMSDPNVAHSPNMPEPLSPLSYLFAELLWDRAFLFLSAGTVVMMVGIIIFFIFSDRIPTKRER